MDRRPVGHVEMGEPKLVVILGLKIIHCIHLPDARGYAVAALNIIFHLLAQIS